ncbi:hypothetical protein APA_605 [Pseudanabaena sp. lw0831]|nr:hypothetical protein APA_605 [Pseudanabaena sp. lw0831]
MFCYIYLGSQVSICDTYLSPLSKNQEIMAALRAAIISWFLES